MNYNLKVIAKIWDKETNSLFDYETSEHISSSIIVNKDISIAKVEHKLINIKNKSKNENIEFIAHIKSNKDLFDVDFKNEEKKKANKAESATKKIEERPWLIIRYSFNSKENGYRLREGDLLKFGKVLFKVREIKILVEDNIQSGKENKMKTNTEMQNPIIDNIDVSEIPNLNDAGTISIYHRPHASNMNNYLKNEASSNYSNEQEKPQTLLLKTIKKRSNVPICRICLSDDYDLGNPLINPCKCSGTMKYIHLNCLRLCFKSKIQTKVFNFLIAHCYKTFECDLCKKVIQEKIKVNNRIYSLIELQRPANNYIILESISEKNENKFLYLIHMKDRNSVRMGRASDADVRITDISVSRSHAELKLVNNSFYISDTSSKFGTLVQINYKLVVMPYNQIAIQLRKNFLIMKMNKQICSFISCYQPKGLLYADYNDYFSSNRDKNEHEGEIADLNITESVCKYDSRNDIDNSVLTSRNNVEIRNNDFNDDENRINNNLTIEDDRTNNNIGLNLNNQSNINTINTNYNYGNNNGNNVNLNQNNHIVRPSARPSVRPSFRLNININLQDVNNGNIHPIGNSPTSIDLNLKINDVKNLGGNLFQIPGMKESVQISENSGLDSPEKYYFQNSEKQIIDSKGQNVRPMIKSKSNKSIIGNNKMKSNFPKDEEEEMIYSAIDKHINKKNED